MISFLDFEKPIAELEGKVHELRLLDSQDGGGAGLDIQEEISTLQEKADKLLRETYAKLLPWQKVQVARHPNRPQFQNYVSALIEDFVPMAGDRNYGEDYAIQAGIGRFDAARSSSICSSFNSKAAWNSGLFRTSNGAGVCTE